MFATWQQQYARKQLLGAVSHEIPAKQLLSFHERLQF